MRKLTLLVSAVLAGCAPSLTPVAPGPEFELAPGATVELAGTDLRLSMVEVSNDSRCPSDVVCVTAGSAAVRMRVRGPRIDSVVTLNTGREPRTALVGSVRFELIDLAPTPRAGVPVEPGAYRARVRWSGS